MREKFRELSIRKKMHMFIIVTVLIAVFGTAVISYQNNLSMIDSYYKDTTLSTARNCAMFVDGDYVNTLVEHVLTDDYEMLRRRAELMDDDFLIETYLKREGLWDKYSETRNTLAAYQNNSDKVKYMYIVLLGDENATTDMYIFDEVEAPIYKTGYIEDREEELIGMNSQGEVEPTISNGEWGWLCSSFVPVYDSEGNIACHVGCDISMDDVMQERHDFLMDILFGAFCFTLVAVLLSTLISDNAIIKPLKSLTKQMKDFKPIVGAGYSEAHVVDMKLYSQDEIQDLYQGVRSMQTEIVDFINRMSELKKENERAENDIRKKNLQIGEISIAAYKDALTGVGSKSAYNNAVDELNAKVALGSVAFAIVMVDINNLKKINDENGHEHGDEYIKGCCRIVCNALTHSPVFRIGGDEFVAILQGTDYVQREVRVNEIRLEFEKSFQRTNVSPWLRYSAAVGMAESGIEDSTVEAVLRRADEEMYTAKNDFKAKYGSYR